MKIWIISSGIESLILFKILNKFEFEYIVYLDQNNFPYGDKDFEYSLSNIQKWIEILKSNWAEIIICPPVYESHLSNEKAVLPLFGFYLLNCLQKSLVWKIGFAWDLADMQVWQTKFEQMTSNFILNQNQQKIKDFHFPFAVWNKETTLWKYFIQKLWFRDWMVRKTIKTDLKYFKDAWIDTFIPLNYWYFAFEKIIKSAFNWNKTRFHWLETISKSFEALTSSLPKTKYNIEILVNWTDSFLTTQNKFMDMLSRWWEIKDFIKKI